MTTRRLARTIPPMGVGRRAPVAPLLSFNTVYLVLIVLSIAVVAGLLIWGGSYYATPLIDRSYHPLHLLLRPSGRIGLSLGIVGAVMMLLIFVYSLRKRWSFLQRIGTQSQWLKLHIFFGLAGPILVTFHTSGKLNGIVAIGFYAMWSVVASGIVGRYIYAKIPRTVSGDPLGLDDRAVDLSDVASLLRASEKKEVVLENVERFLSRARKPTHGVLRGLGRVVLDDLRLPVSALTVWRIVGVDKSLSSSHRARVSRIVLRQQRMLTKLSALDAIKNLFSYWHVFHKPFTVVTFVVLFVHVAVVAFFGGIHW